MKSKISIIACFAAVAMLILPANVSAGSMTSSAWTDQTSYTLGDLVEIYVEWEVTDPQDFVHDYCIVTLNPHPVATYHAPIYAGDYNVTTSSASGVVTVYCNDDDGTAYYEWDSDLGWVGTWIVDVTIDAFDYGNDYVYTTLSTNTFSLN